MAATEKVHPYSFAAKDDVAVLLPLKPLSDATLLYVAALLNRMIWPYSLRVQVLPRQTAKGDNPDPDA